MGLVGLKGVEIYGKIGVLPEERQIGRKFVVNIEVEASLTKAGISDSPADIIDYARISACISEILNKEFRLIEAAARAIAEAVLNIYPSITTMKIRIEKVSPLMRENISSAWVDWHYPEDY